MTPQINTKIMKYSNIFFDILKKIIILLIVELWDNIILLFFDFLNILIK